MFKNIVFRILAAIVLLAAIAGIAGFAFNAGMLRGESLSVQAPAAGVPPVPGRASGGGRGHHPPGFPPAGGAAGGAAPWRR